MSGAQDHYKAAGFPVPFVLSETTVGLGSRQVHGGFTTVVSLNRQREQKHRQSHGGVRA